jgi:hypothetical protein
MLEPSRTGNSTLPVRFLRTVNQSLAKHNRKPTQIMENNHQQPKSIASFCRVFRAYSGGRPTLSRHPNERVRMFSVPTLAAGDGAFRRIESYLSRTLECEVLYAFPNPLGTTLLTVLAERVAVPSACSITDVKLTCRIDRVVGNAYLTSLVRFLT